MAKQSSPAASSKRPKKSFLPVATLRFFTPTNHWILPNSSHCVELHLMAGIILSPTSVPRATPPEHLIMGSVPWLLGIPCMSTQSQNSPIVNSKRVNHGHWSGLPHTDKN